MKNVKIENGNELACPACGSTNLHHGSAEHISVFMESLHKDGKTLLVREDLEVFEWPVVPTNYYGRRDAIRIHFYCEGCPKKSALEILQHKGTTFIEWLD